MPKPAFQKVLLNCTGTNKLYLPRPYTPAMKDVFLQLFIPAKFIHNHKCKTRGSKRKWAYLMMNSHKTVILLLLTAQTVANTKKINLTPEINDKTRITHYLNIWINIAFPPQLFGQWYIVQFSCASWFEVFNAIFLRLSICAVHVRFVQTCSLRSRNDWKHKFLIPL